MWKGVGGKIEKGCVRYKVVTTNSGKILRVKELNNGRKKRN